MIYVTHDQQEALTFAEQVTVMNMGEALQTGKPQDLHHRPAAPFVGYFIGSPGMNLFDATPEAQGVRIGDYVVPLSHVPQGDHWQLGIRPEYIEASLDAHEGWLEAHVKRASLTGNALMVEVSGGGLNFKVIVAENSPVRAGDNLYVRFPEDNTMLYQHGKLATMEAAA
jgi:glycerol transport system ATP-binding protein